MNKTTTLLRNAAMKSWKKIALFCFALGISSISLISCSGGGNVNADDTNDVAVVEEPSQTPATEAAPAEAAAPAAAESSSSIGVGPVKESLNITGAVDKTLADKGKAIFEAKCTACHNTTDQRKVGPGLKGVSDRRQPEWIMNMILNPEGMIKEDPTAIALMAEYMAPMANQSLAQDEARAVVEFFRQNDGK